MRAKHALFLGALLWCTSLAASASAQGRVVVGPLPGNGGSPYVVGPVPVVRPAPVVRPVVTPVVRPEAATRAFLAERRRINLERFRRYVEREIYPRNTYAPGLRSVLIDEEGRFCAAATIMAEDGLRDVVVDASRWQNDLRIADQSSGPFHEWMLTSGFTREEIDAIQEPFAYIEPEPEPRWDDRREEREKERLKRVYRRVLAQLARDEARSLDLATARLVAHRTRAVHDPVVIAPAPPYRPVLSVWAPRSR